MTDHSTSHFFHTRLAARLKHERQHAQEVFDRSWPFAESTGLKTPRMTLKERLSRLEMTQSELKFLMQIFGPKGSKYQKLKYDEKLDMVDPKGWRPEKGGLSDLKDIADHFLHRRHVLATSRCISGKAAASIMKIGKDGEEYAYEPTPHTRQLIIDLDLHSVEQYDTAWDRYRAIRELIVPTPLVFRTSRSGSMQLVWFLSDLVPVIDVVDRTKDAFSRSEVSLSVKAGVEIFPTPSMACIRMPLGAHSAFLEPETLKPIGLSPRESYELLKEAYDNGHDFEQLFHPDVDEMPVRHELEDLGHSHKRDPVLEQRVWDEGKVDNLTPDKVVLRAVAYAYYQLGVEEEQQLIDAIEAWVESKLPERLLTHPGEVLRIVRIHLDWVARQGVTKKAKFDFSRRLTVDDYKAAIDHAQRIRAGTELDVDRKMLLVGIADLLLAVKQRCGRVYDDPVVPLWSKALERLEGWSEKSDRPNYYRTWLKALRKVGLVEVVDSTTIPGKRSRMYRLHHHFGKGEEIPSHQQGFDLVLGEGEVKLRQKSKGKKS